VSGTTVFGIVLIAVSVITLVIVGALFVWGARGRTRAAAHRLPAVTRLEEPLSLDPR
jgi:hypothetical protein